MAYSKDEVKAITDKVLDMCKADAVEVVFSGGERSATRFANSSITANLVEHDQEVQITVYYGKKTASATTHQFDDDSLKRTIEAVQALARRKPDNPEAMPPVSGPQPYLEIDAALPSAVNFGPAERAKMVKASTDLCEKKGVLGAGYIPKFDWVDARANSAGLFNYFHYADASFILTCRTPDQTGSGWAGTTGVKDIATIDAEGLTMVAADKALKSARPRALEPGNYTVILEPRPAARYLSLMLQSLNARAAEEGRSFMSGKERGQTRPGEKVFGDNFTLRSEIGNPILRQSPIGEDGLAAKPVTWIEKGVVKNLYYDRYWAERQKKTPTATSPNMSLVMEGGTATVDEMIKATKRGLLVSFFWYIRPVDQMTLLNTGMTRDGLFLIENGEIVGPVQNFRWNMSPLVAYNNLTLVGKPVPMLLGESFDSGNAALVPPVRIEEFYMTSVSPAV